MARLSFPNFPAPGAAQPGTTLAAPYNPDTMPRNLRRAHQANDRAVDRLYRPAPRSRLNAPAWTTCSAATRP
ncbi:MAG: hypothetical protein GDA53_05810 [Rhodobacteraceae bacterium]|nr:hypothetical protein [Paracoccaceae bacterium]